ncbi:MAG: hypothetical protein IT442_11865 [Phycisphaeraceae bacterium]|nr:hypothetical protein [Phycisphaeraceae bacterium]
MLITRLEAQGRHGKVTIERPRGAKTVEIVCTIENARPGEQSRMTWRLPATSCPGNIYSVACQIQECCDGVRGTGGDISSYHRELERFMD